MKTEFYTKLKILEQTLVNHAKIGWYSSQPRNFNCFSDGLFSYSKELGILWGFSI